MAKKTENKTKEQERPAATETVQEAVSNLLEIPAGIQEATDNPLEIPAGMQEKELEADANEILGSDIELTDDIPELEGLSAASSTEEEQPEKEQAPEEKILFYIKTVNDRTNIRSTPEYPMRGTNVIGTIDNKELYGIVQVVDGFGRLAKGAGWVLLDSDVVARQG